MNYGDSVPTLVSYNGFVNGDSVSSLNGDLSYSSVFTSSSNAGNNNFTISIGTLSSSNYNISIGVSSAVLTINAVNLVISALANVSMNYGASVPALVSYSGFVNGQTSSSLGRPASHSMRERYLCRECVSMTHWSGI